MGLYNHRAPTEEEMDSAIMRTRMMTNENEPNLRAAVFPYVVAQLVQEHDMATGDRDRRTVKSPVDFADGPEIDHDHHNQ